MGHSSPPRTRKRIFLANGSSGLSFRTAGNTGEKGEAMNQLHTPDPQGAQEYFRRKTSYSTGPVELNHALDAGEDLVVIDVREAEDYEKGHIPGSVNLPRARWSSHEGLREG